MSAVGACAWLTVFNLMKGKTMQRILATASVALAIALTGGISMAADLKAGDAAPAFKLTGSDGKTYSLAELKGTTVVIAWYPKAFTGG